MRMATLAALKMIDAKAQSCNYTTRNANQVLPFHLAAATLEGPKVRTTATLLALEKRLQNTRRAQLSQTHKVYLSTEISTTTTATTTTTGTPRSL